MIFPAFSAGHRGLVRIILFTGALVLPAIALAEDAPEARIRQALDALAEDTRLKAAGPHAESAAIIADFYRDRDYAPAWRDQNRFATLLNGIDNATTHGLDPGDYHQAKLLAALEKGWTARADILASDAVATLALDLKIGKVDPVSLDPHWNLGNPARRELAMALLTELAAADDLPAAILGLPTDHFFYEGLRYVLTQYRLYAEAGGWETVPEGPSLKPGMTDPRIAAVRKHLVITDGADEATPETLETFDDSLVEAVIRFQTRHGLDADGVVGPQTLEALNVPVEERIQQIRVNLERARWVLHGIGDDFVIVNIAGYDAFLIRDGAPVWSGRVMVGRPYRKTPVFTAEMSYLVLNPTWTVPPTIFRQDKLPAIREDPAYLERSNMTIRDAGGGTIDPASIDWQTATAANFPYQIVQGPGPNNALGRIKFMFPNKYFVYLHDTPNRELFSRSVRTFSSGCIRLQNPLELAERLLAGQDSWTQDSLETAIATGKTRNITLENKIPVVIMYWTVQPSPVVGVRFFRDVYDRDSAVLKALDTPR